MVDQTQEIVTQLDAERSAWVRPEVSRISAGDAEGVGATGDDGVIGVSS